MGEVGGDDPKMTTEPNVKIRKLLAGVINWASANNVRVKNIVLAVCIRETVT